MRKRLELALGAFLVLLPWIFFDIDLGDAAYHSLSSWLMAFHPKMPPGELPLWFEQVPVWFSYFVDSLWWKVIGADASILATRFGWLFFQISVLLGLYEAFRRLFPGKKLLVPLLLGLLAVNCGADDFVISYYVVPPAFGALAFAWLAVGVKAGESPWFATLAGAFAVLSIQSRLPAVLPIMAACMVIFLLSFLLERNLRTLAYRLFYFGGGIIVGLAIALICLWWSGQGEYFIPGVRAFWAGVSDATNQRYSKGIVLERMVGHYTRIAIGLAIFAPAFFLLSNRKLSRFSTWMLGVAGTVLTILAVAKYGTVLAIVIGGAVFSILLACGKDWRRLEGWQVALALGAFACLAGFTLGTFLEGIQTFKYGLWLLVPTALLLTTDRGPARLWLPLAVVILFSVTRILWPTFPYFERPIFRMTSPMRMPRAAGLFTYSEKETGLAQVVDELQARGVKPGEELLVYAGVPSYYPVAGINLLTKTVPVLHDPGLVEYPGARWARHREMIRAALEQRAFPKLAVRQKDFFPRLDLTPANLLFKAWAFRPSVPEGKFAWTTGKENGLPGELDELLRAAGYQPVWENAYFVVLAHP